MSGAYRAYASEWIDAPRAVPEGPALFAIGDVHGYPGHLTAMRGLVRAVRDPARDTLVLLGDYIDRGPDNLGALDLVAETLATDANTYALAGNHDLLLRRFIDRERDEEFYDWRTYGGDKTQAELGLNEEMTRRLDFDEMADVLRENLGARRRETLAGLRPFLRIGDVVFAHAGTDPREPLESQNLDTLAWIRRPFLSGEGWSQPFTVVHGHTISAHTVLPHRVSVDSGIYHTGVLSCLEWRGARLRWLMVTDRPDIDKFMALPAQPGPRAYHGPHDLADIESARRWLESLPAAGA